MIKFYDDNIPSCKNTNNIIDFLELQQHNILKRGFKIDSVIKYNDLDYYPDCKMFNPLNVRKYISNNNCFAIKWKYLGNYLHYEKLDNVYLNYLMRYLKLVKNEFIPNIPNYFKNYSKELFNYEYYKITYKDLSLLSYKEAYNHFILYGEKEKRLFNKYLVRV